mmetsp:Transcript_7710/g.11373  ORF Transcript_7710/g.11373 Transcript_7710/m.11373 type:complete len:183 (+) Transcript_7710:215-763(+)
MIDAVDTAAHHLASLKSSPAANEKKSVSHTAQSIQDHRMHQGGGDQPDPIAVESTIRVLAGDIVYNSMASTVSTDDGSSGCHQSVNALLMAAMAMTQLQGEETVSPASIRKSDFVSVEKSGTEKSKPVISGGYVSSLMKNDIQYSSDLPVLTSRSSIVSEEEMKSDHEIHAAATYSAYNSAE